MTGATIPMLNMIVTYRLICSIQQLRRHPCQCIFQVWLTHDLPLGKKPAGKINTPEASFC